MRTPTQKFNAKTALSEAEENLKWLRIKYTKDPVTGVITVPGGIAILKQNLKKLPNFSSIIVEGDFYCQSNQLTSLAGAPRKVGGSFWCEDNKLTSLAGAPQHVSGDFWCDNNPLEDMYGVSEDADNYYTPFGDFISWAEIPDDIKKSPARIAREKEELCKKIKDEIHAGTTRELHTTRIKFIKKKPAP